MKIADILNEGMEFGACKLETRDDGTKVFSDPTSRQEEQDCPFCDDGTDKYHSEYKCSYCKGTGKVMEWVSDSPEMQVSNSNGYAIQRDILDVEPDYGGSVMNDQLPALRKKLLRMVNQESRRQSMHKAPSQSQKQWTSQEDNVTTIHRGAQMHDMGRSDEQVLTYAQQLLDIVDYAMKNDCHLTWG